MADEADVIRLRNEFFRDGFYKVLLALALILVAFTLLVFASLYLFLSKPKPISFSVADNEWRILGPVSVEKSYLPTSDLLQWVSTALPASFNYDFINYTRQQKSMQHYFTPDGWSVYSDLLNNYANFNTVTAQKQFISANAASAPFILNQGLLKGRYAWWVQMPINISYSNADGGSKQQSVIFQVLVVRVPTLNNLEGVAIDNLIVFTKNANQARPNG